MAELDRAQIKARLKQSRDEAGITQAELGDALELHWRSIQNYEDQKNNRIPWDRIDQWAALTGRTKEWILHGDDAPLAATQGSLLEELEALRLAVERVEAGLARLADRLEPPGVASGP